MARTRNTAGEPSSSRRPPASRALRAEQPASTSAGRSARKQPAAVAEREARSSSISDDESDVPQTTSNKRTRSTAPLPTTRHTSGGSDVEAGDESEARTSKRQRSRVTDSDTAAAGIRTNNPRPTETRRVQPNHPSSSTIRSTAGKSLPGSGFTTSAMKALKRKSSRKRRPLGFVPARGTGRSSEEDESTDENDGQSNDDDSGQDSDDVPRARSLTVAGYTWKSQEVVIRPHQVVNALKYRKQRKFSIIVDKERNRKALASGNVSSLSEADGTDPDDPLVFRKEIVFKRGDLVYFLPDPAWLEELDDQQTITVEDLRTEEWWIGLVLDCVELRNKNGEADAVLRVAWCYSPDQARALFADSPTSPWARKLENHEFWDNEMVASDHIDFVGADSTGGRYTGSFDQNQEEIEIELKYEKRLEQAKQKYREKYSHVERSKRPPFHPPDRSSLPTNREKICIRLMVCGLEQSDVERCTPPSKFGQKFPHARRYVEAVRAVKLDDFVAKWTAQLSHRARVDRSGLPSSVVRSTIAAQDEKNARDMLPEQPKFGFRGKGKGKGKGRGKTVLPAKSGRGKSGYGIK